MQNIPPGLIPYSHELYLTGNYIAETRGGYRPPQVVKMEGLDQPIVFIDEEKEAVFVFNDGLYNYNLESEHDLFLRPKTVKKWIPMFTNMLYDSEEECTKKWIDSTFLKAIEVELPIDQIK